MSEKLTTVVSGHTFYQAHAKNILQACFLRHKDTLSEDEKIAIQWGLRALDHTINCAAQAWIKDKGILFWAEVFGADGSACGHWDGGFCRKDPGETEDPANSCGYCYHHFDQGAPSQRVCFKTPRAISTHKEMGDLNSPE